jgi:hypothetical protein
MQTDVKAAYVSATGTVFGGRTRLRGFLIVPGASAGSVVLRDGGASGTTVFNIVTAAAGAPISVLIPAEGVLFATDIHATLSNAIITAFYG